MGESELHPLTPEIHQQVTGVAGAVATLIVGVTLVAWDFLTHKVQTGGVLKSAGSKAPVKGK